MAADTLTDVALRHLRELREVERAEGSAWWRPENVGQDRCAQRLVRDGHLVAHFERGRYAYEFTPAGREALARHEENDAANDTTSLGAARHTEAGDRRG